MIGVDQFMMVDRDKILDRHKIDEEMVIKEELIDKITAENDSRDRNRQHFRRNFSNDRNRSRERSPTPRRSGNRCYNSPNLGTRNRLRSRVTTNSDQIRCFRCREYDHFANECPNDRTNDSAGYESDSTTLQLMTTELEAHENFDTIRMVEEEEDHLKL